MILRALVFSLSSTLVLFTGTTNLAQESDSVAKESVSQAVTDADIAQLIRDLDGNRFSKRQDASRKLKELGERAVPALTEAAMGNSREAASRAFAILKDHFNGEEGPLQAAAKAALKKLAESNKATVARKAQDLLDPKPPPQAAQPIQIGGGQVQIQFGIGGAQQIQMKNVNGAKSINVKENGRSIQIDEDPNKGIKIEVTEKVNGKDVKKKYEAKDAAELKKKHPEGHKIYEKYGKGGPIQFQRAAVPLIRGIQLQAFPQPQLPAAPRLIDGKAMGEQLEKISAQVDEAQKLLEKHKANPQQTESLEKAIQQLKDAHQALKKARELAG